MEVTVVFFFRSADCKDSSSTTVEMAAPGAHAIKRQRTSCPDRENADDCATSSAADTSSEPASFDGKLLIDLTIAALSVPDPPHLPDCKAVSPAGELQTMERQLYIYIYIYIYIYQMF